jgi:dCTP deaminase
LIDPRAPIENDGILPSQWIRAAIEHGIVIAATPVSTGQIQPNSLDLRLGSTAFRVQCSFLPGPIGMKQKLGRLQWAELEVTERGLLLETNQVYIFPLSESLELPAHVLGRANPKSSTGRLDVFTRLVTEHGSSFDDVPPGYKGNLYLEVVPRSFAIQVRPGDSLAQIRFQVGDAQLTDEETASLLDTEDIVFDPTMRPLRSPDLRIEGGVFLSINLSGNDTTIGFRAVKNAKPIDLQAVGVATVRHHWQRIYARPTDPVVLEPDEFYIFASRESVCLPPRVCAEMVPYDASSGELRTHYAGFFDSGFGYSPHEPPGFTAASVVLEIRNRDVPFLIEEVHPLFRLLILRNTEEPDLLYGTGLKSNYQGQRLRLSKQFKGEEVGHAPPGQRHLPFFQGQD